MCDPENFHPLRDTTWTWGVVISEFNYLTHLGVLVASWAPGIASGDEEGKEHRRNFHCDTELKLVTGRTLCRRL